MCKRNFYLPIIIVTVTVVLAVLGDLAHNEVYSAWEEGATCSVERANSWEMTWCVGEKPIIIPKVLTPSWDVLAESVGSSIRIRCGVNYPYRWWHSGVEGFKIYRSTSYEGQYEMIAENYWNNQRKYYSCSYQDKNISEGTEYFYKVYGCDSSGKAVIQSGVVSAVTLSPSGCQVTELKDGQLKLEWDKKDEGKVKWIIPPYYSIWRGRLGQDCWVKFLRKEDDGKTGYKLDRYHAFSLSRSEVARLPLSNTSYICKDIRPYLGRDMSRPAETGYFFSIYAKAKFIRWSGESGEYSQNVEMGPPEPYYLETGSPPGVPFLLPSEKEKDIPMPWVVKEIDIEIEPVYFPQGIAFAWQQMFYKKDPKSGKIICQSIQNIEGGVPFLYKIFRKTTEESDYHLLSTDYGSEKVAFNNYSYYVDTNTSFDKGYWYKVSAFTDDGKEMGCGYFKGKMKEEFIWGIGIYSEDIHDMGDRREKAIFLHRDIFMDFPLLNLKDNIKQILPGVATIKTYASQKPEGPYQLVSTEIPGKEIARKSIEIKEAWDKRFYRVGLCDEYGKEIIGSGYISTPVIPPLPRNLRASPGDGFVKLTWEKVEIKDKDEVWVVPPQYIIRRLLLPWSTYQTAYIQEGTEIARFPLTETEYIDKDVQNGTLYRYDIVTEGVSKIDEWTSALGQISRYTKIWKGRPKEDLFFSEYNVYAMPRKVSGRPRIAVMHFFNKSEDKELIPLQEKIPQLLLTGLSKNSQIEMVERQRVEEMVGELLLGKTGILDEETTQMAGKVMGSDYLIWGSLEKDGGSVVIEVQMQEVKTREVNKLRKITGRIDEIATTGQQLLQMIYSALNTEMTHDVIAEVKVPLERDGRITLAVPDFKNNSGDKKLDVLESALADMLVVDLSSCQKLRLVDRNNIDRLLKELNLSLSGFTDKASVIKVGNLLGAQTMLLVDFTQKEGILTLDTRLVDVDTGRVLKVEQVQGEKDDLKKLEIALVLKVVAILPNIAGVSEGGETTPEFIRTFEANLYLTQGLDYWKKGKWEDACSFFSRTVYLNPDYPNVNIYKLLAECNVKIGKKEEALRYYKELLKRYGTIDHGYLSEILKEMVPLIISVDPTYSPEGKPWEKALFYYYLADAYTRTGGNEKVLEYCQQGLDAIKDNRFGRDIDSVQTGSFVRCQILDRLAVLYENKKDYAQALKCYLEAWEETFYLMEENRRFRAPELFELTIYARYRWENFQNLISKYPQATHELCPIEAKYYRLIEPNPKSAIAIYENLIKEANGERRSLFLLQVARIYAEDLNEFQKTKEILEGLKIDSNWEGSANLLFEMGRIYSQQIKDWKRAEEIFDMIDLSKLYDKHLFEMGEICLSRAEAIGMLPMIYGITHGKPITEEQRRMVTKSLRIFQAYLDKNPSGRFACDAQFKISDCLLRLGEYSDAKEVCRNVLNNFPNSELAKQAQMSIKLLKEIEEIYKLE